MGALKHAVWRLSRQEDENPRMLAEVPDAAIPDS
jgi:hypothetical protein